MMQHISPRILRFIDSSHQARKKLADEDWGSNLLEMAETLIVQCRLMTDHPDTGINLRGGEL